MEMVVGEFEEGKKYPIETLHFKGAYEIRWVKGDDEAKYFFHTPEKAFEFLFSKCKNEDQITYATYHCFAKDETGIYYAIKPSNDVELKWTDEEHPDGLLIYEVPYDAFNLKEVVKEIDEKNKKYREDCAKAEEEKMKKKLAKMLAKSM